MAGEYLPPVVTQLTGDIGDLVAKIEQAKAAMKSLGDTNVKVNFDVSTASLVKATAAADAMTAATNRTVGAGRRWTGWLATAHMILTAFGANIIADTIGIVAFGVGAVAALGPAVEAFTNLGATYAFLNPLQKNATVQITNFVDQFQRADRTGIFAVFTGLLDMVSSHVGQSGGIIDQATRAFENFVAMLRQDFASAPWQQLFARGSSVIQTDLTALFHLLSSIIGVIPALFHDFNGLGLFFINSAAGILHWIAIIGNTNPALMRFAAMVFFVYRALRMLGQFNTGSMLMKGLGAMGLTAVSLTGAFQNFQRFGLIPTLGMMTGLSVAGLAAAGGFLAVGAATAALIVWLSGVKNTSNSLINTLTAQDHATGTNIAGYQRLAQQLQANISQGQQYVGASRQLQGVLQQQSQAQQQAAQTASTLRGNLSFLENTYHLTQQQAFQLAKATGVNLMQAFNKGGGAAQLARLKIAAYEQTVKASQNPTSVLGYDLGRAANTALQLDNRVTALTNAFNALLTPFANVIQDTVTWRSDQVALEAAIDKSNGRLGYNTVLQRASASALATSINDTTNLSSAILQQTGSMQKAAGPILKEIAYLQNLHSTSNIVAQAIANLQAYINNLHSKTITITTVMNTISAHSTIGPSMGGHAAGTSNAPRGWAMVGERGPELMYFRGGEKVIPNHQLGVTQGLAGGTGGQVIERQPIVVMLDKKPIYQAVKEMTYQSNIQNNVRTPHGSAQGRFGTR